MAEVTKKRWNESEDTILRESVKQGLGLADIAKLLNRTEHAIVGRKWYLEIDGRFKRSANKTHAVQPAKAVQAIQPAAQSSSLEFELFQIEDNVPLPSRGKGNRDETLAMIAKCDTVLGSLGNNQSFVVPRIAVRHVLDLAKTKYQAYKVKTSATAPNKKFFRIFRVA